MRFGQLLCCIALVVLSACSGGTGIVTPAGLGHVAQSLDLSPDPVELTNDTPAIMFTVQNDVAGVSYTAKAGADCQNAGGGIFVAGDGQPQTAVAGTPTMFLTYAVGTPPDSCKINVAASTGESQSIDATYQTVVVQSHRRMVMSIAPGVTPTSGTISKANQVIVLAVSNFSGAVTANAGSCATGSTGISATASAPAGTGTVIVAPFGVGAVSKSCTVTVADAAGNRVVVPITLAISSLNKFTVTGGPVQFGCAASALPMHCRTIQNVTLSEAGAKSFVIGTRAFPKRSCAAKFEGPLKFVSAGGAPSLTATGPSATVAFDGLLPASAPGCEIIAVNDGGDPEQIVQIKVNAATAAAPPPAISAAAAPPCKGNDPLVAMPGAPHGMFVWAPGPVATAQMVKYNIIGNDPTLCGASIVVFWSDIEPSKGVYDFSSVEAAAAPYTSKNLTVNFLFADATEGAKNQVTPPWVLAEVPHSNCAGPDMPAYWDPTYEADWEDVISHAITYFTNASSIRANVGYMRFATGGGAEALPPPGLGDPQTCQAVWAGLNYTPQVWVDHTIRIVNAMGSVPTTKQIIASLPELPGNDLYAVPNQFAAAAVAKHVGLAFESLGSQGVTGPSTTPGPCNPQAKIIVLHFCQAFTRYAGVVPLAMQPITASINTTGGNVIDITKLLPYALDNNIQIFELYPDEWLVADGPTDGSVPFVNSTNQPIYKNALRSASLVLGATDGH